MANNRIALVGIGIGLLIAATPAMAHHAFAAEFDSTRPVKLQGTVTRMEWINPHSWLHIDVTLENGVVEIIDHQ